MTCAIVTPDLSVRVVNSVSPAVKIEGMELVAGKLMVRVVIAELEEALMAASAVLSAALRE